MTKTLIPFVVSVLFSAHAASAATITTLLSGNDCGNPKCVANDTGTFDGASAAGTAFVIKFKGNGSIEEINAALFPYLTGAEFAFAYDATEGSGTWTYTPGAGDPLLGLWTAKAGPNYNLFFDNGTDGAGGVEAVTSGIWATPLNPKNGKLYGLGHLSFYAAPPAALITSQNSDPTGTGPVVAGSKDPVAAVPEPASLWLLGLAGIAAARRAGSRRARR